jgi:hypothetical protein
MDLTPDDESSTHSPPPKKSKKTTAKKSKKVKIQEPSPPNPPKKKLKKSSGQTQPEIPEKKRKKSKTPDCTKRNNSTPTKPKKKPKTKARKEISNLKHAQKNATKDPITKTSPVIDKKQSIQDLIKAAELMIQSTRTLAGKVEGGEGKVPVQKLKPVEVSPAIEKMVQDAIRAQKIADGEGGIGEGLVVVAEEAGIEEAEKVQV